MSSPLLKVRVRTLAVLEMLTTAGPAARTTDTTGVTRFWPAAWPGRAMAARSRKSSQGAVLMTRGNLRITIHPMRSEGPAILQAHPNAQWPKYGRSRDQPPGPWAQN